MRHDEERLSAFLDDELDDQSIIAVRRHVEECGDCEQRLEELSATRAALRSLPPVEAPLSFMVESVVLGPPERDDGPSTLAIGAVVAASVLLITAFVVGGERGGAVAPDVDELVGDHIESVGGGPVVVPVMLDPDDR